MAFYCATSHNPFTSTQIDAPSSISTILLCLFLCSFLHRFWYHFLSNISREIVAVALFPFPVATRYYKCFICLCKFNVSFMYIFFLSTAERQFHLKSNWRLKQRTKKWWCVDGTRKREYITKVHAMYLYLRAMTTISKDYSTKNWWWQEWGKICD